MVKFTIDNKHYEITEKFTVSEWLEIMKWDFEEPSHWPRIISAATGAPLEILQQAEEEGIELAIIFIATVINQRKEAKVKDFNEITFGEWIDLDIYMTFGIDKHMNDILKILSPETELASEALWITERYSDFRLHMYKQYSKLFGLDEVKGDPDAEADEDAKKKLPKKWYEVIISLAGDDILNIDAVTEQPLKKALNFMAYRKEKLLEEQQRILKERRKNDILRNSK